MSTIAEESKNYEGKRMKSIVELKEVSVAMELKSRDLVNREGESFTVRYIEVNGEEFRVPDSVLSNLKMILESNPSLKTFMVRSSGTGLATSYTVVPLS